MVGIKCVHFCPASCDMRTWYRILSRFGIGFWQWKLIALSVIHFCVVISLWVVRRKIVVFLKEITHAFLIVLGQVRYEGIRRSSASPRPHCDGTSSSSVWPSPRQTPGLSCPYPTDRTAPDATMKRVDAPRQGPVARISTRKNPMGGILSFKW